MKAEVLGVSLWGHDIDVLIQKCKNAGIDIRVPKLIKEKADMYTHWEAECRYFPIKVVRKDSIMSAYNCVKEWLDSDVTK